MYQTASLDTAECFHTSEFLHFVIEVGRLRISPRFCTLTSEKTPALA